jgi:hypothetical protein
MSDQLVAEPLPDNTQHSQETDIPAPAVVEPPIPVSEQPQIHALDRAATGIGGIIKIAFSIFIFKLLTTVQQLNTVRFAGNRRFSTETFQQP